MKHTKSYDKIILTRTFQSGIEVIMPAILLRTPIRTSQKPVAMPARRLAHLVMAITPLFWLKVVLGILVKTADRIEHTASDMRDP